MTSWSSEDEDGGHMSISGPMSTSVLCDVISRKTLFHLISTLNAAFPDYEFSSASSSEFSKEAQLQVCTEKFVKTIEGEILWNYLFADRHQQRRQPAEHYRYGSLYQNSERIVANFERRKCSLKGVWNFIASFWNKLMLLVIITEKSSFSWTFCLRGLSV